MDKKNAVRACVRAGTPRGARHDINTHLLLLPLLLVKGGEERGSEPSREQGAVKMSFPPEFGVLIWGIQFCLTFR